MSRIWNFSRQPATGTGTEVLPPVGRGPGRSVPGGPAPVGLPPGGSWSPPPDEVPSGDESHYVTRPVRPVVQVASRVALWGLVALGALGGIVSMASSALSEEEAPEVPEADPEIGVPAPVAGMAELVTEEWLTASTDDEERLDPLFVQLPPLDRVATDIVDVLDTRAVAGQRLEAGYWTVTVAVNLVEVPPVELDENGEAPPPPAPTTWYVEVGIVGEVGDALQALTTPAIVPPPVLDEPPWQPSALPTESVGSDDRIASTVEDFLNALLAGQGDPARYLATNVEIPAVRPAPFVEVNVLELSGITLEDDEADVRLWVLAEVATAASTRHVVGYEIRARENIDRWEIVSIWGAPAVDPADPVDESEGQPSGVDEPEATTTTAPESADETVPLDEIPDEAVTDFPADEPGSEDPTTTTVNASP